MKKEEFFLTCRFLGEQLAQTPCCSRLPSPDQGDDDDDDYDDDDDDDDDDEEEEEEAVEDDDEWDA